jgi:hypothetical protein
MQPRFDRDGWVFSAEKPLLEFCLGEQKLGAKICIDASGAMLLASDSFVARKLYPIIKDTFAAELKRPSGAVQAKVPSSKIHIDMADFGNPPGKWEKVPSSDPDKKTKTFVYVPFEVVNGLSSAPKVQQLNQYWVYQSEKEPEFQAQKDKKEWVFQGKRPKLVSTFDTLDSSTKNFLRKRYHDKPKPNSEPSSGEERTESAAAKQDLKKDIGFRATVQSIKLVIETERPKLNPLILGVLVSELVCHPKYDLKKVVQRFCESVSASFSGVRSELWVQKEKIWICADTVDGTEGRYKGSLTLVEPFPQMTPQNTLVVPVMSQGDEEEQIIGALVFGDNGVEKVSIDSAQAYSCMAKGLIETFIAKA